MRTLLVLLPMIVLAGPVHAQEIFSWFNRGLLPVSFERGDWVRYAIEEVDEYGSVRDTVTVTVLESDSSQVWLGLVTPNGADFVALDPRSLVPGADLLSSILRVVRTTEAGLAEEDVDELRESALVQRHFSDPFQAPEVRRLALPDTMIGDTGLTRERVDLAETRREAAGPWVVVTTLSAVAELSPGVPLIGLLRSRTLSEVTTESASGEGRSRRRPPLVNENSLVCIDYGRDSAVELPDGLR
jgi:hypothetical protein